MCDALARGTDANLNANCRQGSIDTVDAPGKLIATGDIHDNPVHLFRVLDAAGYTGDHPDPAHLTLHELIHPDRLIGDADYSYRALVRVAAIKAAFPEHAHTLLANHELAQIVGAGIVKNGVRVVDAFNDGLSLTFHDDMPRVEAAIAAFVRSMPLALRCHTPNGDILCAHSLPGPAMMGRFDPAVLDRPLTESDYEPRTGPAHMMVWGRGYDADQLEDLVERWGVTMFILGHQHVESGIQIVPPNAIVLNSDHARGVYLPIDLDDPPTVAECPWRVVPLADA